MEEYRYYTDLLKAHKIFTNKEGDWKFYDVYMKKKDSKVWLRSGDLPIKEGMFLFGFVLSWDSNFQGDLAKFLETYKDIFPILKKFEDTTIIKVDLNEQVKNDISMIFDKIADCPRKKRFESTDASKILHTIIPELFVMWDDKIRKEIVKGEYKGRCYAFEFLPKMQGSAIEYLDDYIKENGGNYESAALQISKRADNYTLSKLIDEYNYVRYTYRKNLSEIRNVIL
jgi:hypothetical protein